MIRSFITNTHFDNKDFSSYPNESANTIFIGISFNQEGMDLDTLTRLLTPFINLLHSNLNNFGAWYDFVINVTFSISEKRIFGEIITIIYNWSFNCGYVDAFYGIFLIKGIKGLGELVSFFINEILMEFLMVLVLQVFL
ncbi:NAD(P)H-quinone oxidoreductase subunit 5 chloroplastic [Bienertia sinuspersici]